MFSIFCFSTPAVVTIRRVDVSVHVYCLSCFLCLFFSSGEMFPSSLTSSGVLDLKLHESEATDIAEPLNITERVSLSFD